MKAFLAAAAAFFAPLAAAHLYPVVGDERIGAFRVKSDGTLGGAIRAFGTPALRRTSDLSCVATWKRHALTIYLYNLGGNDPCTRRGLVSRAARRDTRRPCHGVPRSLPARRGIADSRRVDRGGEMDRKQLLTVGDVAAVAAAVPAAAGASSDRSIVGSWFATITATEPPLGQFSGLMSFHEGGVFTEARR